MKFKKIGINLYKNDKGVLKGSIINGKISGFYKSNNEDEYYYGSIFEGKYYTGKLKKKDMVSPIINYLFCDFEGYCLKGRIFNGKATYYDNEFSIIEGGKLIYNSFE